MGLRTGVIRLYLHKKSKPHKVSEDADLYSHAEECVLSFLLVSKLTFSFMRQIIYMFS